jgi:hypothetical protein
MPISPQRDAIAAYMAKGVSNLGKARAKRDKGVRLVEYSKSARIANTRFSWVSEGGRHPYANRAARAHVREAGKVGWHDQVALGHAYYPLDNPESRRVCSPITRAGARWYACPSAAPT